MTHTGGQGLLFGLLDFAPEPAPAEPCQAPAAPRRPDRRHRPPVANDQVEIHTAPALASGTAPLPKTIADCRGPGICPLVRCRWNVLVQVTREGDSETISTGGRGGKGKGVSLTATRKATRTAAGKLSHAEVERRMEALADALVETADSLPSTCLWDYVEDADLIPGRGELDADEDHRTGHAFAAHMTLEQIARVLGVTRERVRLIEIKALMRLRRHPEADELDPEFVPAARLTKRDPR